MNTSDNKNTNKKDAFFSVLIVQCVTALLLTGVMLYSFFSSGDFYKIIAEGYEEQMTQEFASEDLAEAFMKVNEYAEVFAEKTSENIAPAGGNDILFTSLEALEGFSPEKIETGVEMTVPLDDYIVSSEFGYRIGPITGEPGIHTGLDLAADYGTPVRAAADGEVVDAAWDNSYGNYVKIEHDNNTVSIYAHCSSLCADEGDTVSAGDVIAKVGSTGDSTGNHLHFEIRKDNIRINPSYYIDI